MPRLAAVVTCVLLATLAWQGHAFLSHSFLLRSLPRRRAVSGVHSLKCHATFPLIEATACRVLKMVLRNGREAHVSCKVHGETLGVLQGKLRSASVHGRGWASRLGLTARTVAVDVGSVNLNVGALFRRRVLEFRAPSPSGTAVIVFDAADFGNFLAHKLVREAVLSRRRFVFDREDVSINASLGIIEFGGRWGGQSVRIALSQAGARKQLVAKVVTSKEDASGLATAEIDTLSRDMSNYFNNLEIDLDGPKLRFVSLSFEGRGVKGGKLKLHLSIVVQKLPSIRAVASF